MPETPEANTQFEDVRNWGRIRGIDSADAQHQYQRFFKIGNSC